ncbi:UDP-glucose 4-epimerase GalE [Formicincola oecophyllae]|uniref:UDP-glucose 4-epimerase n=1 Tax=Formicincola oecophyllae TaxID=2558361 RepID=A0A4Y6UED5_9PROT|nr:UDP-glucose 4-epimerase GalE [Formicincola oecophyllae]QDH14385.1 UDP-glucose 4-epimerase GalE [Formicincola oecophyllae]
MRCLVTGGAGYVGSHTVLALLDAGHDVTVLDDLSTGHLRAVPAQAAFHRADLQDLAATRTVLATGPWDAVLHFAGLSEVGTSMKRPYHYLRANGLMALNLLEACAEVGVKRFVLSSTAALFPGGVVGEGATPAPHSPYGESKLFIERSLKWAERLHGMRHAILRYFNAAGADRQGRAGEDHRPETHLIPRALEAVMGGRRLRLHGLDYPTPDGSCVRDYIHVNDLAAAHLAALDFLEERSLTCHVGSGHGFSNLQVLSTIKRVTGREVPWERAPRRAGDPPSLVADARRLQAATGWRPLHTGQAALDDIVRTAWAWRQAHPHGYGMERSGQLVRLGGELG